MKGSAVWVMVEYTCRVLGISTAAVLCAVGIETLTEGEFKSLAVYLLFSSVVIMLFEVSYFIDALLAMCLPCPPTWKFFIVWKKMAKVGGFQKFLYYTMMSVMCFLHPVLVWHAVIPDMGDTEQTFSFFHITSGKRASFFHSNSQIFGPTDSAQSMLGQDQSAKSAQRKKRQTDTRNVHFIESFRQDDNEMEEYHEMEPEETMSDKAPMIRL
ncbi:transmembrane protein 72-like isoform X2 [Xyrauchen texanus]|uniref:transmembrane protein 72-like isoform X2 n=1 Tax=Xyrauchen texanus TaxID=154827 RepID=UPI0022425166|nr:transmembrane protein 72-like isoform X2 [Xyrauchen texanus]